MSIEEILIRFLLVFEIGVTFSAAQDREYYARDRCVDEAYQQIRAQLLANYPSYMSFTNSLSAVRNLYQVLFIQGFTTPSFRAYCETYKRARNQFDRCPQTKYKQTLLSGLYLADYLCIHRVDLYAKNLPCLQPAHRFTLQTCSPGCNQFRDFGQSASAAVAQQQQQQFPYSQNGYNAYQQQQIPYQQYPYQQNPNQQIPPYQQQSYQQIPYQQYPNQQRPYQQYQQQQSSNVLAYNNPTMQMAADCQYQKCLADCRRPLFTQQCGREASELELQALYHSYAAIRNMQEPTERGSYYERGVTSTFPAECAALAMNGANDRSIKASMIGVIFGLFVIIVLH